MRTSQLWIFISYLQQFFQTFSRTTSISPLYYPYLTNKGEQLDSIFANLASFAQHSGKLLTLLH